MHGIFDPLFSSLPHSEMYRSWVYPDIDPEQRQPVLKNWHTEDLAAYCGGVYVNGAS